MSSEAARRAAERITGVKISQATDSHVADVAYVIDEEMAPLLNQLRQAEHEASQRNIEIMGAAKRMKYALIQIFDNHSQPRMHKHGGTTKLCADALTLAEEVGV